MTNTFALDLKVARRKAGLTQDDCAHLLDARQAKISMLESGKSMPSIKDICTLSLIYGKSFESLFGSIMGDARNVLRERLASLPQATKKWIGTYNRHNTLDALSERLENQNHSDHGTE